MNKQSTLGFGPSGLIHFDRAVIKATVNKTLAAMTKLGDTLDKVRRGPVEKAKEAGFKSDTPDKVKEWCTEISKLEGEFDTTAEQVRKMSEAQTQLRDTINSLEKSLDEGEALLNEDATRELAADLLGWLLQGNPRMRLFVKTLGCEMTPEIQDALERLDPDPSNSLAARMSQVATQGPSRDQLTETIASLQEDLKASMDAELTQNALIDSLSLEKRRLEDEVGNEKKRAVSQQKDAERRLQVSEESRLAAIKQARDFQRERTEASLAAEEAREALLEKGRLVLKHELCIEELEARQTTLQNAFKSKTELAEARGAEVSELRELRQKLEATNSSLTTERDEWKNGCAKRDTTIGELKEQVVEEKAQFAEQAKLNKDQAEQRAGLQKKLEEHQKLLQQGKAVVEGWRARCGRRDASIQELQGQVKQQASELQQQKDQLTELVEERDQASSDLEKVHEKVANLRESCDSKAAVISRLKDEAKDSKDDAKKLRDSIRGVKGDLAMRDQELREVKENLSSMTQECEDHKARCIRRDKTIADSKQKLSERQADLNKLSDQSRESLGDKDDAARVMARLVMAKCPSGEWQDIMARIDWNSQVVVAKPTKHTWDILESWSKNPMLEVQDRTDSLTALFLLVIAAAETGSLVDLLSYLSSIQLRLDDEPECIPSVVNLFLESLSKCLDLPDIHVFQVFVILQVAKRIGEIWSQAEHLVQDLLQCNDRHPSVAPLIQSVEEWAQKDFKGGLHSGTSMRYGGMVLVGFFRSPNGILFLEEGEMRWIDHDFVNITGQNITIGEGEEAIVLPVRDRGWNWWFEHIL